jgi:hypothetical protein
MDSISLPHILNGVWQVLEINIVYVWICSPLLFEERRKYYNPKDANAVAILDDDDTRKAYCLDHPDYSSFVGDYSRTHNSRDDRSLETTLVGMIESMNILKTWVLKPKEDPDVVWQRAGPQQRCNIGCKLNETQKDAASKFLNDHDIYFQIKCHSFFQIKYKIYVKVKNIFWKEYWFVAVIICRWGGGGSQIFTKVVKHKKIAKSTGFSEITPFQNFRIRQYKRMRENQM